MIDGERKMYIAGSYHPACEIIEGQLATWGAGDQGWSYMHNRYNLIQQKELEVGGEKWPVTDCRDMIDGSGNPLWLYEKKINDSIFKLETFGKVIICCIAGISRSNSIAMGVLIKWKGMDYIDAYGEIRDKVPYADIDNAHLNALKKLFPSKYQFTFKNKKGVSTENTT